jgi:hemerythrin-like domain-containing protein
VPELARSLHGVLLNFYHRERNMPSKTADKSSSPDAIEILTEDHDKIIQLLEEFQKLQMDAEDDEDAKQILIEKACTELTIHSQVEEEFFYPALRDALDDASLLDEAEVEHAIANQLITELESMEPGDDLYEAKFTVLGEYVRHHISEEQEKIFPKVKNAKLDLESLGAEIHRREDELRAEFGMPEEEVDGIRENGARSEFMQQSLDVPV